MYIYPVIGQQNSAEIEGKTVLFHNYRFSFNGKENDNEAKGTGNSIDFGARMYDPRIGRWLSVDALTKSYPDESPYSFAGNSPLSLKDDDGNKKTYYITKIATDGTVTKITVVEESTVQEQSTTTKESIGYAGVTLFTSPPITNTKTFDVAQNIIIDEKSGIVTVGKEYPTTERSNSAIVRGIEDNTQNALNYLIEITNGGSGVVFTSKSGQGQETRKGTSADTQKENIDLLLSVLNTANSAASSEKAITTLNKFKQAVEIIAIGNDLIENLTDSSSEKGATKSDSTYCGTCDKNVSNKDTSSHYLRPEEK